MQPDPSIQHYQSTVLANYQAINSGTSLAGRLHKRGHHFLEATAPQTHHPDILELGAGTVPHLTYIHQDFKTYMLTDCQDIRHQWPQDYTQDPKVNFCKQDASQTDFADNSYDRIIAAHLLEHIPEPHKVLREWNRLLREDGLLSILLPCDPGLLWRFGRHLGPRRFWADKGIAYDYWMAREHINSITNLTALIRYFFPNVQEHWYPLRAPSVDLNLFYIAHIRRTSQH